MSLISLPAFLTRRREETLMPETTTPAETTAPQADDNVLMRFLTQGGAVVDVHEHAWTETYHYTDRRPRTVEMSGFNWTCRGCDGTGRRYAEGKPTATKYDANEHAAMCRAMPKPEA